jgi:FdhD protein
VSGDGLTHVEVLRVDGATRSAVTDAVAVERPLEVRIDGEAFSVIMRTPGDDRHLAVGFLLGEGLVTERGQIVSVEEAAADVIAIQLTPAAAEGAARLRDTRRHVAVNSSCGMCGRPSLASLRVDAPPIASTWTVPVDLVTALPDRLATVQSTFARTGGLHAAALVSRGGDIIASAEDVGRHNAVDRVLGRALGAGWLPLSEFLLVVSGRTSYEIVQKAWMAGVPLVAAVSAPSSLAIDLAAEAGITLLGFVRGQRCNIYTHAHRIDLGLRA